jgi:hypothetical protein
VGLGLIAQHTPLIVTISPPSELTLPPLITDVDVISVNGVVCNTGSVSGFSLLHLLIRININPIINNEEAQDLLFILFIILKIKIIR